MVGAVSDILYATPGMICLKRHVLNRNIVSLSILRCNGEFLLGTHLYRYMRRFHLNRPRVSQQVQK